MTKVLVTMLMGAACLGPGALAAQVPVDLKVVPRVGWFAPMGALDDELELGSGPAVGLAVELDLPMLPLNVRANVDYAPDVALRAADGTELRTGGVLTAVADLVFRPAPTIAFARPYLLTGLGVKHYAFDGAAASPMVEPAAPPHGSDFTFHAGLGVDVGAGPVALAVELSDYLSSRAREDGTADRVQNDLFLSVGIRVGVF